jgi:hypothetical protein
MNRPHICENHWEEWIVGSAIDPEIAALNVESLNGQKPYESLLYNWESGKVHPDAIWREINRRFGDNWLHGGWWCSGVDVLTGEDANWGCFKPDKPRADKSKGFDPNKPKLIKYEHPVKTPTEIFALRVPRHIWQKISSRFNVPIGDYVFFWEWVKDHPEIPLVVTEGAKKAGTLLTAGYAAIALPGVRSGYRQPRNEFGHKTGQPYLIPQLQVFAQSGREIYLCFDQDLKQQTVRNVNQAISATAKLFTKQGCKVKVVVWHPELGKGADDLIVAHGAETFDKAIDTALPSEIWGVVQLVKLTYPVDLELNSRYLGDFAPPPGYQLICLKAPKGTGKTQWLARQVEPLIHAGGKVLLLTHRIQLGEELCNRLGIDYVTELRDSETGGLWGYGLCVDSLHPKSQARFNPDDWTGAYIVIDEAEQVIWHLLNSSTCQSERVAILRCLKQVIQTSLSTEGKIFLSDADLSDIAIDYVRSLAGFDLKPWVVCNNWKPEQGWTISNYGGNNPSQLVADLANHIEQGGTPFVCVSGQKKKSRWGTQNLEVYLQRRFPDKRILRIDRESIADPEHPAYGCMAHLNEILPQYDIVLVSPTVETGVSIDCVHFTSVWGIFQGVQACDSVRQALARVRSNVPRYVWIRKTGFSRVANGSTSIKALLASQHKLTQANVNLLIQAGFTDDIDGDFQPESLHCWAKKAAVVNLGMTAYRATILEALVTEGHTVQDADTLNEADGELVKEAVEQTRDDEYQVHCSAVAEAESLDQTKYEELKDKRAKTSTERLQSEKGELERRYHVPITPEVVEKDANGWHPQLRLHYYLTLGREHLPAREASAARKQLEAGEGAVFKPDFNKRQLGAKIAILDTIGFDKLLAQREFRGDDTELLSIANLCKRNTFELKAGVGITISQEDSPMAIAQRLVGLIGYRFPCLRREGSRGNQVRVYGAAAADFVRDNEGGFLLNDQGLAVPISDGRDEVFAAWLERDTAAIEAAALSNAEQQDRVVAVCEENVSSSDTVARGNKYISISAVTTGGVTTEGGDYQATELSPVEELIQALSCCESPSDFAAVVEEYPSDVVESAIALQDSQPRRQQLTAWYEPDTSEDASFCLGSLGRLESEDITSETELIALFQEMERRGQHCESLLPGDFWQRASSALGVASAALEAKENQLESAARLLREAIAHGADTIRSVLGRWDLVRRWEAVLRLEENCAEDMQRLMQVAPNWAQWCEG